MNFLIKFQAVQEILIIRLKKANEAEKEFVFKQHVCSLVLEKRFETSLILQDIVLQFLVQGVSMPQFRKCTN